MGARGLSANRVRGNPGTGPEDPWAFRLQYLGGNSELLESDLNAFNVELARCRGVNWQRLPHTLWVYRGHAIE